MIFKKQSYLLLQKTNIYNISSFVFKGNSVWVLNNMALQNCCFWLSFSFNQTLFSLIQKPESLSHEELVRRASSLVTDSTNTFLSQTTLALLDSLLSYVKVNAMMLEMLPSQKHYHYYHYYFCLLQAINSLVTLHKQYVASISKLSPAEEEAIWQVVLRQRQEVTTRITGNT